ncbi:unannotated protein [freshwater metagenome]|uniref:Unannotated protein n=1 Tax=freshwater metagenome TaxID=449393 RepID=A0A6J7EF54_9ZZZZ|nr:hypothetical protein [Actinomycetota bacterium]
MNSDNLADDELIVSDEESRGAMRSFLQRAEVRLSTIHRVAQALLGGSALILLLPLFLRDAFPKMMTVIIASYDAHQNWVPTVAVGIAAALVILLPVPAVYLLVGDLLAFYFTSNTFGAHPAGTNSPKQTVFNPRFIIPGLGFNTDELSPATKQLLAEGRNDEWTRGLLVPHSTDDDGWRDRFDTRTYEVWGVVADEGAAGDTERVRQAFRLAGLNRDRTLAKDVARTEALVARHVLAIRTIVLRYSKALLLLIATTVVTLAASGLVDQAIREDPTGGKFSGGFPYRYIFLVALVYAFWAPLAARSVTAPLRMIQRHTPGVGELRDAYLDRHTTQFESATILVTLVVLVAADTAMIFAGARSNGGVGLALGIVVACLSAAAWIAALNDFGANPRDAFHATMLLIRGYDAPDRAAAIRAAQAVRPVESASAAAANE